MFAEWLLSWTMVSYPHNMAGLYGSSQTAYCKAMLKGKITLHFLHNNYGVGNRSLKKYYTDVLRTKSTSKAPFLVLLFVTNHTSKCLIDMGTNLAIT